MNHWVFGGRHRVWAGCLVVGALLVEAGYYLQGPRIGLFGQWGGRDFSAPSSLDEGKTQIGVAWYWMGRNLSLKLGLGGLARDGRPDRDEVVLQLQTFMF